MRGKRLVIFILLVLIAAGAAGYFVYNFTLRRMNSAVYDQMQQTVSAAYGEGSTSDTAAGTNDAEDTSPFVSPIDFESLWAVNEDIYAWIEIPDTDIAYPVLQHPTDSSYYLNYTVEGNYGYPGSIYTETGSAKDFSDFNTVIYGHNMKDGSMFGNLKDYRDADFLDAHRTVMIYTPTATLTYKIFAAVIYNNTSINYAYDFTNVEDRQAFLDSLDSERNLNSQILDDVEVGTDDNIITLSTCISGQSSKRYLVLAVLVNIDE